LRGDSVQSIAFDFALRSTADNGNFYRPLTHKARRLLYYGSNTNS